MLFVAIAEAPTCVSQHRGIVLVGVSVIVAKKFEVRKKLVADVLMDALALFVRLDLICPSVGAQLRYDAMYTDDALASVPSSGV